MSTAVAPETRVAALETIEKMHQPDPDGGMGHRDDIGYGSIDPACITCGTSDEYAVPWPCRTVRAAWIGLGKSAADQYTGPVSR